MRYPRNTFLEHYSNANGTNDKAFQRDLILDEIAFAIKNNPNQVIKALRKSKINIKNNANYSTIVSKVIDNIYQNHQLKKEITQIIALQNSDFSSFDKLDQLKTSAKTTGSATASGASSGGVAGGIIGAIGGITQSVFDWKTAETEAETEKLKAKTALMDKIMGGNSKRKWLPIVIVGGVLLIGGVILYFTLKKK